MKSQEKQNVDSEKKKNIFKKACLIVWSTSLLILITSLFLTVFRNNTLSSAIISWLVALFFLSGLVFAFSFYVWLGLKLERHIKAINVKFFLVCLFVFVVSLVLDQLRVGFSQIVVQICLFASLSLSFLLFITTFPIWLILKFKRLAVVLSIILVALIAIGVVGFFLYSKYLTKQQTEACRLYIPNLEQSLSLDDDFQKAEDRTKNDIDVENSKPTPQQFKIVLLDFQYLQQKKDAWYYTNYSILDIFSKYIPLFSSSLLGGKSKELDIGLMKNTIKNIQNAQDEGYKAQADYAQALIDNKSQNELQLLYKDTGDKINNANAIVNSQNDNLNALNMEGMTMYSKCYDLLKMTAPLKNLQAGSIYW